MTDEREDNGNEEDSNSDDEYEAEPDYGQEPTEEEIQRFIDAAEAQPDYDQELAEIEIQRQNDLYEAQQAYHQELAEIEIQRQIDLAEAQPDYNQELAEIEIQRQNDLYEAQQAYHQELAEIEIQKQLDLYDSRIYYLETSAFTKIQNKFAEFEKWEKEQEEPEKADLSRWKSEHPEQANQLFMCINENLKTLRGPVPSIPVRAKIQSVNERMPSIITEIIDETHNHFEEPDWNVINNTIESSELKSAYHLSKQYLDNLRFYARHDLIHALLVTKYSLELVSLLYDNQEAKSLFSNQDDLRVIKLIVTFASLWHDSGNSISRENHQDKSVMLARPHISNRLTELDLEDREAILIEILKVITFHTSESGHCENLESAVVRLADGIDCTILRCGESGEQAPLDLFVRGQISHIYGKAGIDEVEISNDPGQNRINVKFSLDPIMNPDLDDFVGPSIIELQELQTGKLQSLEHGPDYARFFQIDISRTEH